jgi:hypothetical protein
MAELPVPPESPLDPLLAALSTHLEARFTALGTQITAMAGQITAATGQITAVTGQLTAMETTMAGQITAVTGQLTTMAAQITAVTGQQATMAGQLAAIQAQLGLPAPAGSDLRRAVNATRKHNEALLPLADAVGALPLARMWPAGLTVEGIILMTGPQITQLLNFYAVPLPHGVRARRTALLDHLLG